MHQHCTRPYTRHYVTDIQSDGSQAPGVTAVW